MRYFVGLIAGEVVDIVKKKTSFDKEYREIFIEIDALKQSVVRVKTLLFYHKVDVQIGDYIKASLSLSRVDDKNKLVIDTIKIIKSKREDFDVNEK